jgi:hypothetical protein
MSARAEEFLASALNFTLVIALSSNPTSFNQVEPLCALYTGQTLLHCGKSRG